MASRETGRRGTVEDCASRSRDGDGTRPEPASGNRRRSPGSRAGDERRRRSRLLVFLAAGLIAIAVVYALGRALDDERPHGPFLIGAWTFGDRTSLTRAVDAGALDEVSLDWLRSRPDGSVAAPRLDAAFMEDARRKGCRVFVTLTDYDESVHRFDPRITSTILATAQRRRHHVEAVATWCRDAGVDGVDVDWEAVTGAQRDSFSEFVEDLAHALHDDGRELAVDVYPKMQEPGGWAGPRAQDWKRLGRAVDQFRVMTYNYSGSWSGPGPMSPPEWIDNVLDFAESRVSAGKIVMGLGLYGRSWMNARTTDLVWQHVESIRRAGGVHASRGRTRELVLRYRHGAARHAAYFPDAEAVDAKLAVVLERHPHIRGVCCWSMGQEDPAVWRVLRTRLH
jgi:spore germination protein